MPAAWRFDFLQTNKALSLADNALFVYIGKCLCLSDGFHHHRIQSLSGVHAFGENDFENRIHSFALFDGNVDNLTELALKTSPSSSLSRMECLKTGMFCSAQ